MAHFARSSALKVPVRTCPDQGDLDVRVFYEDLKYFSDYRGWGRFMVSWARTRNAVTISGITQKTGQDLRIPVNIALQHIAWPQTLYNTHFITTKHDQLNVLKAWWFLHSYHAFPARGYMPSWDPQVHGAALVNLQALGAGSPHLADPAPNIPGPPREPP